MTIDPRHRTLSVLAVVTALLLTALLGVTVSQATAGTRAHQASAGRIGVGTARSLGSASRCPRRIAPARAKRLTQPQRRRVARLLRTCRRRLATESSGPHNPIYWGATVGDQITGTQAPWDMNAVSQFEALGGKRLSLVNFFAPFANCSSSPCSFYKFPTGPMENIRTHGAIPVFSWSSQSIPSSSSEPDFQLADVIAGTYDSYIREFATAARSWGHPFFLRFNWEMNGNWFPWSESINGNQPGEYIAAWRHVHDIFTSVGATNATWVWCPNIDPWAKLQAVDSLYPGDEYVDWTGLDGYNWGPKKGGWTNFDRIFRSSYDAITEAIAPGKPLMIAEVGSTETGGSKANWISEAFTAIPAEYPMVRGVLWFDKFDDGMDWPIETSASASSALAASVQDAAYQTNEYGDLSTSPIPPPS